MQRRKFLVLAASGSVGLCLPALASNAAVAGARRAGSATLDRARHRVVLELADGGRRTVGGLGTLPGYLNGPKAVVTCGDQFFVLDSGNHRVQVFDARGNFVRAFGKFGKARGELAYPRAMIAAMDGTLVVADTLNHRLVRYRDDGTVLAVIEGHFNAPHTLRVDGAGDLHVTDHERTVTLQHFGGISLA